MIYQTIKEDLKNSMKNKSSLKWFIRVVISEFDRKGKNLSDEECLKSLKILLKDAHTMDNLMEITYLESFFPKQMSEEVITKHINTCFFNGCKSIGEVMKVFNTDFKGLADNKLVSQITKNLLKN